MNEIYYDKKIWNEIKAGVRQKLREGKFKRDEHIFMVDMARKRMIGEGALCARCATNVELTIDHIIPISLLEKFDLEEQIVDEENFQILCRRCNRFKEDRLDFLLPKTKELLLKYVNLIK